MKFKTTSVNYNDSHIVSNGDSQNLRELIAVSEPYFALKNIENEDNRISAFVQTECLNHDEVSGMSIAEVGRHMAILGSLAMANSNPKKEQHYYLATDAIFERISNKPYFDTKYKCSMETIEFNKRKGFAKGTLVTNNNEAVYNAQVEYAVLNKQIFERMFGDKKQDTSINNITNPYNEQVTLSNIKFNNENYSASLGKIKTCDCIGHFNNFPAMPVARMGGALVALSGHHYNALMNTNEKYCIRKAQIHAKAFVFSGQEVTIHTRLIKESQNENLIIESYANTKDCERVAELKCWFC